MELKLKQKSLDILGSVLLIVLNGIEIRYGVGHGFLNLAFNRTKWN